MIPSFPPDIYAIGVGKLDVDWKELNELGSKKDGERHAFILQDAKAVQQVFEHMLGKCALSPLKQSLVGSQLGTHSASLDQRPSPTPSPPLHPQMSLSSQIPSAGWGTCLSTPLTRREHLGMLPLRYQEGGTGLGSHR